MTLFRATIIDTPGNPFTGDPADALAADQDGGLLVRDGDHHRPRLLCHPASRASPRSR